MASNRVVASVPFKNMMKGGKEIAVAVATRTEMWYRTEHMALSQGPALETALNKNPEPLPEGTAQVVQRSVFL